MFNSLLDRPDTVVCHFVSSAFVPIIRVMMRAHAMYDHPRILPRQ